MIENSFLVSGKLSSLWLFTEFNFFSVLLNPRFGEYNMGERKEAAVPPESLLYHENGITTVQLSFFQSSAADISVIVLQTKRLPSIDNRQTKLKVCHSDKQSFFFPPPKSSVHVEGK